MWRLDVTLDVTNDPDSRTRNQDRDAVVNVKIQGGGG
jgi:hypothetical protein